MNRQWLFFGLGIILLSGLIFSCNHTAKESKKTNEAEVYSTRTSGVESGELVPTRVEVKEGVAYIAFVQSARLFHMDMELENGNQYLAWLEQAIRENHPVTVSVEEGTTTVVEIAPAPESAIQTYQESLLPPAEALADVSDIIPDEATLLALFEKMNDPGIPFYYAVDGCYARAHKMRQILNENGYECEKQFIFGDLAAYTGTCCVEWGNFHVAPLVSYRNSAGEVEKVIVDPSLFPDGPVSVEAWHASCLNADCLESPSISRIVNTTGSVFLYVQTGGIPVYDTHYRKTDCVIATYKDLSGCTEPHPSIAWCMIL
ncbi:MAG: hypothetical protein LIP08_01020 [Bacteroides sp.]|nr:hypothetical protein [Bacteroides sp.]